METVLRKNNVYMGQVEICLYRILNQVINRSFICSLLKVITVMLIFPPK